MFAFGLWWVICCFVTGVVFCVWLVIVGLFIGCCSRFAGWFALFVVF